MYSCFSVTSILCVCVGAYLDRTTYCTNCPLDDITLVIISGGWGSLVRLVFWVHQYHLVAILEPLFAFGSIWLFGTLILFVSQKHENLHHAKIPTSNYTVPLDST